MFNRNNEVSLDHARLTRRLLVLGVIAVICFIAIFFRLWYLGILSGDEYLEQAKGNQVRAVTIQAPRGNILDTNGEELVTNRTALALRIHDDQLPPTGSEARKDVLRNLGKVVDMTPKAIRKRMKERLKVAPASPVVLRHDVPYETVYYLREHASSFPGISVDRVYVRDYPDGTLAAHVLGYTREVNAEQIENPHFEGASPGDSVGQEGVEYSYDSLLRGVNGSSRVQVDAGGRPTGTVLADIAPRSGNDLVLGIDAKVQAAGEAAISQFGLPAGFVAMKVDTGEIVGLGSYPTYAPSVFSKPVITQAESDQIFGGVGGSYAPIFNRVTGGGYPLASTIKPLVSVAALRSGKLGIHEIINDGGCLTVSDQEFCNAGKAVHGPVALQQAIQVSSDVFYYTLGARMNDGKQPLQKTLGEFGLGHPTGIDIPGESGGLVPSPAWRDKLFEDELTDRPWSIGDNINLSIGQGDLQADPLQLAVAYAAIANGGDIVTPHVGSRIASPQGRVLQEINPAPQRHMEMRKKWRQTILDGLHDVAMKPGGTGYSIFGGWPMEIAGKTGTAERPPHGDQSWFVALAPADDPEIVVVATIEQGGFGADTAAPAVAQILQSYFDIPDKDITDVSGGTSMVIE